MIIDTTRKYVPFGTYIEVTGALCQFLAIFTKLGLSVLELVSFKVGYDSFLIYILEKKEAGGGIRTHKQLVKLIINIPSALSTWPTC